MSYEAQTIHNIIIENRKKGMLSGVKEVLGYDNQSIDLVTDMGNLSIRGEGLKISRFSTEKGELDIEGLIVAFVYTNEHKSNSFLSRLFR